MKFEAGQSGENAADFLKLKGGQTVKGVFRGEPKSFETHWTGQFSELCIGVGCPLCAKGDKSKFRFRLNFLMRDEAGGFVAKIWEQGWGVYNQLKDLNVEYPLERTIVTIKRTGDSINDTSYMILPAKDGVVNAALEAKLAAIPLVDLTPSQQKKSDAADTPKPAPAPTQQPLPASFDMNDVPF